jgi:RimJ/RimL family protein N-acetyltransferase
MKLRKALQKDAKDLCEAEQKWAKTPGYMVSAPNELTIENFKKTIKKLEAEEEGIYYVVEGPKEEIMGHAFVQRMSMLHHRHIVRLTICVHHGHQGKGVGMELLDNLVDWASGDAQTEKIELMVRSTNEAAIALYKKYGFKEEGLLQKHLKIGQDFFDDLCMGLVL